MARCVYALAIAAITSPLVGLALQVWPPQFSSVQWRFGAAGLFPASLMIPAFGLLGLLWAGRTLEQRPAIIAFTTIAILVLLVSLPVGGMFVLDAIQLRQTVDEAGLRVFDSSSIGALFHLAMMFVVYGTYAAQGVKTLRHKERKRRTV